jgi:flagellar protein FliL
MKLGSGKAIVILAGCAFLAASGGYGYGRLRAYLSEPPAETADGAETDPAKKPEFVDVGQLVVPVMKDGRTTAFILTQITLEAAGKEMAEALRQRLPNARSALLQSLFGLSAGGAFDTRTVEPVKVARALKENLNQELKGNLVKAVLIDRLLRQENTKN